MTKKIKELTEGHNLYEKTNINFKKMKTLGIYMITTDFIPTPKRAKILVRIRPSFKFNCKAKVEQVFFVITSQQNAYGIYDWLYKEGDILSIPVQHGIITFTRLKQEKIIFLSKDESPKSKCSKKR